MADKKRDKTEPKREVKREGKPQQKTSETVNLSAEELRKISGGTLSPPPPPKPGRS
jgi:hypothetical protein